MGVLDGIFSVRIFKDGVAFAQRKTIEFIGGGVAMAVDPCG